MVRYEGNIPKSLRAWCDSNSERVQEVCHGSGYATDSGRAYDVFVGRGFCAYEEGSHTVIEPTVSATLEVLRGLSPCECPYCQGKED